ncbi:hypothetical protein D3C85_1376620 [compost metagenome]
MLPLLTSHLSFEVLSDIFRRRYQEARCTTSWVTNFIVRCRRKQTHHHIANMLWRSELTILSCGSQLTEHILVEVALHIQVFNIVFIQLIKTCNHLLQYLRRWH